LFAKNISIYKQRNKQETK